MIERICRKARIAKLFVSAGYLVRSNNSKATLSTYNSTRSWQFMMRHEINAEKNYWT